MTISRNYRFGTVAGAAVLAGTLFYASASYGQSLGDVARQERERRKQGPNQAPYVYTNEDLKRDHILVPEDRERVLAARKNESAPERQAQAFEIPSMPVPNSNLSLPLPELAVMPLRSELYAPPMIPAMTSAKTTKRTTAVVAPPKIHSQAAPSLAILVPPPPPPTAPHQAEQRREIKQPAASIHFAASKPRVAPGFTEVRAQLASPVSRRPMQHREKSGTITLVHFERTASHIVRAIPSANVLLADSAPHRDARSETPKPVVALAHFEKKSLQPAIGIPAPQHASADPCVRVEHGDSLWKLAKEHLGSGTRWRELAEMNPEIANPGIIRVGDVIRLPNA